MKAKTEVKNKTGPSDKSVVISAPQIDCAHFHIIGTAPYVQLRFSQKAMTAMREKMEAGSQSNKAKKKSARDFDDDFQQALHRGEAGKFGIPAGAFRAGMISACRLVGFKMTLAKLSVFVEADDFDAVDQVPLVHIQGDPSPHTMHVRNATGVADLRVRAKFWPWSANLRVSYDTEQFSLTDVANLISRVGMQVGIGEGRPDSKASAGMGWGTFRLES
jgi:hypothetical protein